MQTNIVRSLTAVAAMCFTLVSAAKADVVLPQTLNYSDNAVTASIQVTDTIAVDLSIEFEKVVGLNPETFAISAEMLTPNALSITERLNSLLVSPTTAFPVVVSITPDPDSGFAFEGVATVELYTKAIHYTPDLPLRLFTSHADGTFTDMTTLVSAGSIRARGNTGKFSDFMIMLDTRTPANIVGDKVSDIESFLSQHGNLIQPVTLAAIEHSMTLLSFAVSDQDFDSALEEVDSLISLINTAPSGAMPDVWQASDTLVNVEGELKSKFSSLRYALRVM